MIIYASFLYLRRETGKKKGMFWTILRWLTSGLHAALGLAPLFAFGLVVWLVPELVPPGKTNVPFLWGPLRTLSFDKHTLRIVMLVALGLAIVGPYLTSFSAFGVFGKLSRRLFKGWKLLRLPNKLQVLFENYFSVEDMRRVGHRLVATLPLVWKDVHDDLVSAVGGSKEKMKKVAEMDARFGSYKYVRWGSLMGRLEEHGLKDELWALADKHRIPLEDDDWLLSSERVRGKLKLQSFGKKFKSRQQVKWSEVREFLLDAKREELLKRLRQDLDELLVDELRSKPSAARSWPFVDDKLPEPGTVGRWKLLDRFGRPLTLKDWQRRTLARKIIDWAGETGNLTKLTEHMRFVNPEALYEE